MSIITTPEARQRPTVRDALQVAASARSIAILGASADPSKLGHLLLKILIESGYAGQIIPINRNTDEILGRRAYRSLDDVPGNIDAAVLLVPSDLLIEALQQCTARQVRIVATITSGFSEAGVGGERLQQQLLEVMRDAPFRLLGPNCEGFVIPRHQAFATFSLMTVGLKDGPIGIISQSGAVAGAIAQKFKQMGLGVSALISTGNEADVTTVDVLEWLADDPATTTVVAYIEEIRDASRFVAVARQLVHRKAIVIEKSGRGQAACDAVMTHTGAIAGDAKVAEGVFEQLNIVSVSDFTTAVDSAAALSRGKSLSGLAVGVVSIAGGLAVEAVDLLETAGFKVPEFRHELQAAIGKSLPYFAAVRNPVDLTGVALARPDLFEQVVEQVTQSEDIHALIVIITFSPKVDFAEILMTLERTTNKPLLVVWTAPEALTPEPLLAFHENGFPVFDAPVRAVNGLRAIARFSGLM